MLSSGVCGVGAGLSSAIREGLWSRRVDFCIPEGVFRSPVRWAMPLPKEQHPAWRRAAAGSPKVASPIPAAAKAGGSECHRGHRAPPASLRKRLVIRSLLPVRLPFARFLGERREWQLDEADMSLGSLRGTLSCWRNWLSRGKESAPTCRCCCNPACPDAAGNPPPVCSRLLVFASPHLSLRPTSLRPRRARVHALLTCQRGFPAPRTALRPLSRSAPGLVLLPAVS